MLSVEIAAVVHTWATMVAERIQNQWDNLSAVKGEAHIDVSEPVVFPTYLEQRIEAYGQRAWICEFGSGSESDTSDNPYLDDYINDSNFNDYRSKSDMRIRGRDAGAYTDLDGNEEYSFGRNAGKDLEAKPVYKGMTMVPMHIIKEEILAAKPELYSMINAVVADTIMGDLMISTNMYL